MKVTVVPAQVTTVEDRVAGNLGFSQLILLAIPIFGGALLFAIIPPFMGISLLKIIVVAVIAVVSSSLAIRIKGKIVLLWLIVLLRYRLRPRMYVLTKNTSLYREDYPDVPETKQTKQNVAETKTSTRAQLGFKEKARVYAALDNPTARLTFETTKKGGLNVRLQELKAQGQ